MKTIKSYTDVSQSKKLAEILPLESADMFWLVLGNTTRVHVLTEPFSNYSHWESYPCWSLSALLGVLPYPSLHKTLLGYRCDSYNKEGTTCKLGESTDNPIDSCYEMILKLHELKML